MNGQKLLTNIASEEVHVIFVQAGVPGFASYERCNLDDADALSVDETDDLSIEQQRTRVEGRGLSWCAHCWPAAPGETAP